MHVWGQERMPTRAAAISASMHSSILTVRTIFNTPAGHTFILVYKEGTLEGTYTPAGHTFIPVYKASTLRGTLFVHRGEGVPCWGTTPAYLLKRYGWHSPGSC